LLLLFNFNISGSHSNMLPYVFAHVFVQKSYFDVTNILTILFAIILYPLLPTLAHDQQQFAFAYQSTTIKNQINNIHNTSASSHSFAAYTRTGENNKTNSIRANSGLTNHKLVILNFYDDDKGQFINAKPILDKYGFKATFFIVCKWAGSDNNSRMTWQDITQLYR
jgi:hypothetical protein